jgi:hypothetical protein
MTRLEWEEELMGELVGPASIICEMEGRVLRVVKDDGHELEIEDVDDNTVDVELDSNVVVGVVSVS